MLDLIRHVGQAVGPEAGAVYVPAADDGTPAQLARVEFEARSVGAASAAFGADLVAMALDGTGDVVLATPDPYLPENPHLAPLLARPFHLPWACVGRPPRSVSVMRIGTVNGSALDVAAMSLADLRNALDSGLVSVDAVLAGLESSGGGIDESRRVAKLAWLAGRYPFSQAALSHYSRALCHTSRWEEAAALTADPVAGAVVTGSVERTHWLLDACEVGDVGTRVAVARAKGCLVHPSPPPLCGQREEAGMS